MYFQDLLEANFHNYDPENKSDVSSTNDYHWEAEFILG